MFNYRQDGKGNTDFPAKLLYQNCLCVQLTISKYGEVVFVFCFRAFENMLTPKSSRIPYLILFYSDWCFACLHVEPVWRRVIEELEPIGVGIATVHAENEQMLSRRVGIHSLPCLILLIDGKPYVYKESLFSVQKVVGKY